MRGYTFERFGVFLLCFRLAAFHCSVVTPKGRHVFRKNVSEHVDGIYPTKLVNISGQFNRCAWTRRLFVLVRTEFGTRIRTGFGARIEGLQPVIRSAELWTLTFFNISFFNWSERVTFFE